MKLTILGLGPGHPDDLTRRAWQALQDAPTLVLRTSRHPIVETLDRSFTSFDELYEQIEDFGTLYQTIVERVLEMANSHDELVYAVPGHPFMGEQTVTALLEKAGDSIEIIHGLSFIEPALS